MVLDAYYSLKALIYYLIPCQLVKVLSTRLKVFTSTVYSVHEQQTRNF